MLPFFGSWVSFHGYNRSALNASVLKDPAVASSQGASFAETTQRLALSEASGGRSLTPPLSRPGVYRPVPVNQFQEYVAVRDEKRQLLFKEEFEVC